VKPHEIKLATRAKAKTLSEMAEELHRELTMVRTLEPAAKTAGCCFSIKGRRYKLTLEIDPQEDPS
jgi:hypothetical protein